MMGEAHQYGVQSDGLGSTPSNTMVPHGVPQGGSGGGIAVNTSLCA